MALTRKREYVPWTDLITCVDVNDRIARRVCRVCEVPLMGRRTAYCSDGCAKEFDRNHFWGAASSACLRRAGHRCERCGATERLEVNHIEPVRGRPRSATCLNHQANLEVLCHADHVLVTEQQFRPEKVAMRAAQPVLAVLS